MAMMHSFEAPTTDIPDDSRPLPRRTPLQSRRRRFLKRWLDKNYRAPFISTLSAPFTISIPLNCSLFLVILWSGQLIQYLPLTK